MGNLIARFKRFKTTVISRKAPVLFFLNRMLKADMGKVIDFSVNDSSKAISIVLDKQGAVSEVEISRYKVELVNQQTRINWRKVKVNGPDASVLKKQLMANNSIILPAYLFNLVNRMVNQEASLTTVKG